MDKVKFLESRIAELEERLNGSTKTLENLEAVDFSIEQSTTIKVKDKIELAKFVSLVSGGVYINFDCAIGASESASGKIQVLVNSTVVSEIPFNAVAGENSLHFGGACQCVQNVENILSIEITNLTGVTNATLTSLNGVVFGMALKNMRGKSRLSAYKVNEKTVELITDNGKIYLYTGTAPAKSFGDFSYYANGIEADCVIAGETPIVYIARLDTNKNAFISATESVSGEVVVSGDVVDDLAVGKTLDGIAVFYIKDGQVYFRLFNGTRFLSEKLLSRENKRRFVEVGVVGEDKELLVIAKSSDGGNYMYNQVDIEKSYGGSGEKITIKVTAEVSEAV